MFNSILFTSLVPNLIQIGQEVWEVWTQIYLLPEENYGFHCVDVR
jgi:hypothetical protein